MTVLVRTDAVSFAWIVSLEQYFGQEMFKRKEKGNGSREETVI